MSKQDITLVIDLYSDGRAVKPFVPELNYTDSMLSSWNKVSITASAANESMAISDLGTIKYLELRVVPDDRNKITVKYNGSSDAYSVSPLEITTENITAITASNSSTSVVNLYWRAIYV